MTQQEQLEAILAKLYNKGWIDGNEWPKDDNTERNTLEEEKKAIANTLPAITALIQEAVNEGRVAELKDTVLAQGSFAPDRSYSNDTKGIIVIGVTEVEDRIKQLSGGSNNDSIQ